MTGWNFCSDNVAGASPAILEALAMAGGGSVMPYGADPVTARVEEKLCEIFETDLTAYLVATGTAANSLALSALCPPYGSVYCHPQSHIVVDECNAPEFFTGGAKLITIDGTDGKIDAAGLESAISNDWTGVEHHPQPAAVSLTQASEAGTVYTPEALGAISTVCRRHGLGLHMDGARFANALVSLGCQASDISWRAGVDVLSFGATKNGALAAEAVLFFRSNLAEDFRFRRKRGGHLFSKMRFLSVQMDAYLTDDLWLCNARHANAMAIRMADELVTIPDIDLLYAVEANELFVQMPKPVRDGLAADGFEFYSWVAGGPNCVRLVTAFDTDENAVADFIIRARGYAAN